MATARARELHVQRDVTVEAHGVLGCLSCPGSVEVCPVAPYACPATDVQYGAMSLLYGAMGFCTVLWACYMVL
eukprot:1105597-Rhodomonas_salina.1